MKTFKASIKNVRQAPRKLHLAAALIRRRRLDDAVIILEHTPKRAAASLLKLLNNAKGMAVRQHNLKGDSLEIEEIFVNAGRTLKRSTILRRGRMRRLVRIEKKSSHVFITVSGQPAATKTPAKTAKTPAAKGGKE